MYAMIFLIVAMILAVVTIGFALLVYLLVKRIKTAKAKSNEGPANFPEQDNG